MNKRIVGIFNVEDFLERHSIHCWMVDRPLFDSGNFTWNSVFAKWSFENTTMKFERETRLRKFAERRKIFRSSVSSSFFFFLSLVFSRSLSLSFTGNVKYILGNDCHRDTRDTSLSEEIGFSWFFFDHEFFFFFFFRRITIRIIGRIIRVAVRAMEPCEQRTPLLLPSPRQWRRPGTN